MANKRYGEVAYGHGPDGKASKAVGSPAKASVTVKQAFTGGQLPGKASNWYKVKGSRVKQYPSSQGLC